MFNNFFEVNKIIGDKLQSGEPFSSIRIDNTHSYVIHCNLEGIVPVTEFYNPYTMVEAAITPVSVEYALSVVVPKTIEAIKEADVLGFVDVSQRIKQDILSEQSLFRETFGNKNLYTDFLVMDPGALLGYSQFGQVEQPWTQYLAGKRVLVCSCHPKTIKQQWKRINDIWGDKREKIAPFELVDVISTPYSPLIDDRQYANCENFEDLIEITKRRIDQYDYDVLLTGITTQSPFYAQHAKSRGKVGIQTGGTIQLFFGILGKRWDDSVAYANWRNMFNENWIRPLEIDSPQKRNQISFLETSYAYW